MLSQYFLMTNEKGDYGCFLFEDYYLYKKCWFEYKEIGWIDDLLLEEK